jgi:hypothetical protein
MHRRVSKTVPGVTNDIGVRIRPQVPAANRLVQQLRPGAATRTSKTSQGSPVRPCRETAGPAYALRSAPVRSPGFRMPCRERAVELAGGGDGQGTVGGGLCAPGAHGPLSRPVLIPASRLLREPQTPMRCATDSGSVTARSRARRDRELAVAGAAFMRRAHGGSGHRADREGDI